MNLRVSHTKEKGLKKISRRSVGIVAAVTRHRFSSQDYLSDALWTVSVCLERFLTTHGKI